MDLRQAKRVPECLQFSNIAVHGEECRVGGPIRLATPKLVIDDDGSVCGQRQEWFHVVAAASRTAMQQEDRRPLARANSMIPDPTTLNMDKPFGGRSRF